MRKMFKHVNQGVLFPILCSTGSKPLEIWDQKVRNGHIKRVMDNDLCSMVLEVDGSNVSTTYITCPADPEKTLSIHLPVLVINVKCLKKCFMLEIQVLDDAKLRRRFRVSTFQSITRANMFRCAMPISLDNGWKVLQFNLSELTWRTYGTHYCETLRVQIHASCQIQRVYFSDRIYLSHELPEKFKR